MRTHRAPAPTQRLPASRPPPLPPHALPSGPHAPPPASIPPPAPVPPPAFIPSGPRLTPAPVPSPTAAASTAVPPTPHPTAHALALLDGFPPVARVHLASTSHARLQPTPRVQVGAWCCARYARGCRSGLVRRAIKTGRCVFLPWRVSARHALLLRRARSLDPASTCGCKRTVSHEPAAEHPAKRVSGVPPPPSGDASGSALPARYDAHTDKAFFQQPETQTQQRAYIEAQVQAAACANARKDGCPS
ncbi:hypothetical protein HYPSUDRAFT_205333 [Hypholoma sublateritium FD-334 SS-4]|uniref:Uncharacterized protein n=1 Tax=Hypholoma sublateritium (strain FD-334 SS-4) TaxID=945553 RepID=A0A0D2NHS8_HYPSF|nr:hypothetical protein HYPSUDRAFT_205333 [Hypholoma sublateritium FD-334 SS-4]